MKYAYELIDSIGRKMHSIQKYKFTEQQMLNACKESKDPNFKMVVEVKFLTEIPKGYHLCGCGNLVKGTKDELCEECRQLYGHTYEHEL